jgi:ribosomal protein L14E/L6E/L27E
MKIKTPAEGMICESLQGRDKGNLYCIAKLLPDGYVLVADGKAKSLSAPKKKNCLHLKLFAKTLEDYGLNLCGKVSDSQLAFALKTFKGERDNGQQTK